MNNWKKCMIFVLFLGLIFGQQVFSAEEAEGKLVTDIVIKGREFVPERLIREVISLKKGQRVTEEGIQKNVNNIYLLGYFADVNAETETYRQGQRVIFDVVENAKIKKIVIVGNKLFPDKVLKEVMKTRTGRVFNIPVLNEDLKKITEYYNKQGYVFSGVTNMEKKDIGQFIRIFVTETTVKSISLKGNTKTRNFVIMREVSLKVGDYFSSLQLMRSLRRLMNLGFFSNVKPNYEFDKKDRTKINLTLEVTEQKTGSASFGGGYSSSNGFVGFLEVKQKNFRGKGQSVNLKFEYGGIKTYQLGFYDPYFWRKTALGLNLYKTKIRRDDYLNNQLRATYDEERSGESILFGRKTGRWTRSSIRFRNENVKISPVYNPLNAIANLNEDIQTLTLTVAKDTRNNIFKTSAGRKDSVEIETTGGFLKGNNTFTKFSITGQRYGKLTKKLRTAARVMLGFVDLGEGTLPIYEEYGAGGAYTLRGYYTREFTGDHMFIANMELRYDFTDKFTGVAFYDYGDAWGLRGTTEFDGKGGAGVGVLFNSPIGAIRLDYGMPVSEKDRDGRTYFSMGSMF